MSVLSGALGIEGESETEDGEELGEEWREARGGSVELSGVDSAEEGEEAASSCLAGMHARRAPFCRCLLARETTGNGQLGRATAGPGWGAK